MFTPPLEIVLIVNAVEGERNLNANEKCIKPPYAISYLSSKF